MQYIEYLTSNFDPDRVGLYNFLLISNNVDSLANVLALVVIARVVNHQFVLVASLQNLIGWQFLQPHVLG